MYLDHNINRIRYLSNVSRQLISGILIFVFIGICMEVSAQTKKTTVYKAPNFGCTFEDGPFDAKITVSQNGHSEKIKSFSTNVDIQGCQVIHIIFDKIGKEFMAAFKPTDIDDSGNAIIQAERGIKYEIHLILP